MRGLNIKPEAKRFVALEGVRGLAAIIVVFHHFLLAFYPAIVLGLGNPQHTRFEDNIHGTPLALLYAGTFAVAIFFVLSGFVLTIGFFQTKDESIIKKLASKRYLRLMLPALAVTMICLILIKLGFAQYIVEAARLTGSSWLLSTGWSSDATFIEAIFSGTVGIFTQGSSPFDNVLWTMLTEFVGSFIVFAFVLLFGTSKHRWVSYLVVGVLTFNTWFLAFILGMALADLYASGKLEVFKKRKWVIIALAGAILFGSFPASGAQNTLYAVFNQQFFENIIIDYKILYLTMGASLLIFAVLVGKSLSSWLETPRISRLGKYTFSLYLIHLPILYTVGAVSFLFFTSFFSYNLSALLAIIICIPSVTFATILFEKYIDTPSVKLASRISKFFENDESFELSIFISKLKKKLIGILSMIFKRPKITKDDSHK